MLYPMTMKLQLQHLSIPVDWTSQIAPVLESEKKCKLSLSRSSGTFGGAQIKYFQIHAYSFERSNGSHFKMVSTMFLTTIMVTIFHKNTMYGEFDVPEESWLVHVAIQGHIFMHEYLVFLEVHNMHADEGKQLFNLKMESAPSQFQTYTECQ